MNSVPKQDMDSIYKDLAQIVGEEYVSNKQEELYIYSRDLGTSEPRFPDYVVMPKKPEEVQEIVKLANKNKIPLVPMGAGVNLVGLTLPLQGGVVVDLRRMDRILEVNEKSRYAIIEAGVSEGKLKAFLERHYPDLEHSMPEAPPPATVVANALDHGHGHLSPLYCFHSNMLNGLEVVLPTGEVCKIGSCSLCPYWFSSGAPLPDLSGLFCGWFGTTGIVTKAAFKLYPKPKLRDVLLFATKDPELIPEVILRITHTWAPPLITCGRQTQDLFTAKICISGNSEEEMELKRSSLQETLQDYIHRGQGEFMSITPDDRTALLELQPRSDYAFFDALKGGGFEYAAAVIPVEKFPEACRSMDEITSKHNLEISGVGSRPIGAAYSMIFFWHFPFNRADAQYVERVRQALHDASSVAIELGGIPWKPGVHEQKLIMERMEPNTLKLMMKIKELLDPNHIMNPGNWQVS